MSYKVIFQTKKEDINMTDTVEETHELVRIPIVTVTKMNGDLKVIGVVEVPRMMADMHDMWTIDSMVTPEGLCFLAIPNEAMMENDND